MCPIFGSKLFQDIQLIYKKTKIVNIHKFSWIISFVKHFWNLYYTYWPNCVLLDKLTNLFIFDLANLSQLYTTFYRLTTTLHLIFHLLTCTYPTLLLDAKLQALTLYLSFLHTFFVAYIFYTKSWLTTSGSQPSKLSSSRLILSRFVLLMTVSLLKNVTISDFISPKTISSLEIQHYQVFQSFYS